MADITGDPAKIVYEGRRRRSGDIQIKCCAHVSQRGRFGNPFGQPEPSFGGGYDVQPFQDGEQRRVRTPRGFPALERHLIASERQLAQAREAPVADGDAGRPEERTPERPPGESRVVAEEEERLDVRRHGRQEGLRHSVVLGGELARVFVACFLAADAPQMVIELVIMFRCGAAEARAVIVIDYERDGRAVGPGDVHVPRVGDRDEGEAEVAYVGDGGSRRASGLALLQERRVRTAHIGRGADGEGDGVEAGRARDGVDSEGHLCERARCLAPVGAGVLEDHLEQFVREIFECRTAPFEVEMAIYPRSEASGFLGLWPLNARPSSAHLRGERGTVE